MPKSKDSSTLRRIKKPPFRRVEKPTKKKKKDSKPAFNQLLPNYAGLHGGFHK